MSTVLQSDLSKAKKVETKDSEGNVNGFLVELQKKGDKTSCYLTAAHPGCFKGYHLHRVRASNYVCILGRITVVLYDRRGRHEIEMTPGDKLHIPPFVPTGILNNDIVEGWLINFPDPFYDPTLTDEQVEYTEEECESGKYLEDHCGVPSMAG